MNIIPKKPGIANSVPGIREGNQGVDKRLELTRHLVAFLEDQADEVTVTNTAAETSLADVTLDLPDEMLFEGPGDGRKGAMYEITACVFVTDNTSNAVLRLRVGAVDGMTNNIAIFQAVNGQVEGILVSMQAKLFIRPDSAESYGYRADCSGFFIGPTGGLTGGEFGPDDTINEQDWTSGGKIDIKLTCDFVAADASSFTLKQFAIERIF